MINPDILYVVLVKAALKCKPKVLVRLNYFNVDKYNSTKDQLISKCLFVFSNSSENERKQVD